jgi:hypothetical protein
MPISRRYYDDPAYPTTVSRDIPAGEYSFDSVIFQSGRAVLDSELQLTQGAAEYARLLLAGHTLPSGFIRGQSSSNSFSDYTFPAAVAGNENLFNLTKLTAFVAGMPVVVEYSNTVTPGTNEITLPVPEVSPGVAPDIKRTDFVFLEVWRTLVAPSPRAIGTVEIVDPVFAISAGDTVTINAIPVGGPTVTFTANGGGPTGFAIGISGAATATNLATAINNPANGLYPLYVAANTSGSNLVTITATFGGVLGNGITLAFVEAIPGSILLSAATLLGGADRPNKPSQNTIYRHGNVDSPLAVALADELVDPVLNIETAQRVQIQYRIRITSAAPPGGVNPKTQPDGFENVILAQGAQAAPVAAYPFVRANNTTISANSDATLYGIQDNGLYIAGNGTQASAIALGTVDGFAYAIPICFAFRRADATATGGFNPAATANSGLLVAHINFNNTNLNPAGPYLILAGNSDRPDGLFADIIASTDILDLRRHVTPPGYDFGSELKYQLQSLFDKKTATWQVDGSDWATIGNGSGDQSTYPLFCDEIGRTAASGGVAPASGATLRGNVIRNYDHVARRFGSQSVVESMVFQVTPAGALPPGITVVKAGASVNSWCEGDLISIDFDTLDPNALQDWTTGAGLTNVGAVWPAGTRVTDVLSVFHDDGHNAVPIDQHVQLTTIVGIGTNLIEITLDGNASQVNAPAVLGPVVADHPVVDDPAVDLGSTRRIFIELEITYPTGFGLTQTPDMDAVPDPASGYNGYVGGPIIESAPAQRPPEMLAAWVPNPKFRAGYREVKLEQKSAPAGVIVTDFVVSASGVNTCYLPRRFFADSLVADGAATAAGTTYGSSERKIIFNHAVVSQTLVQVDYYPQDPVPNAGAVGYQTAVYYRTNAPQTAGTQAGALPATLLPTELTVEPVAISSEVWTGQTGKGSTELGFPYESPLDQIAIATGNPPAAVPREWYFSAMAEVSISDFSAATGILSLHSFVQVDGTNPIQLGYAVGGRGPIKDPEFRAYYDMANPGGYKPTAMTQPLFGPTRHKVWQPMLVRTTQDTLLFRRGELLLMVVSRFADLDQDNKIAFTDLPAIRTAAALYRTRNLLLTVGA